MMRSLSKPLLNYSISMKTSYNDGEWTRQQFVRWVIGFIRRAFVRWEPRRKALKEASVGRKTNKKTGRLAEHFICSDCGKDFVQRDVQVDHIQPVVDPDEGFVDLEHYFDRMFCDTDNLQILCRECHKDKTREENRKRKEVRDGRK